jgi:hypothetical protein
LFILGDSAYSISKKCTPSYKTIRRWLTRAKKRFKLHKDTLGAIDKYKALNRTSGFNDFWKACFEKITLAAAMRICHVSEVIIP